MSLKTELVIFDWDGTLYNSVGQIVASLQHAAEEHKLTLTDEAAKSIIGLGLPEVMQTLFPEVPDLHDSILKHMAITILPTRQMMHGLKVFLNYFMT